MFMLHDSPSFVGIEQVDHAAVVEVSARGEQLVATGRRSAHLVTVASEQPPSPLTPEQLLAERFARGDIDQSEYLERLATLHGDAPRKPREPTAHVAARMGHVVREDSQGG